MYLHLQLNNLVVVLLHQFFTDHHTAPDAREAIVENDFQGRHKDANINNREESIVQSLGVDIGLLLVGGGLVADADIVVDRERGGDTFSVYNNAGSIKMEEKMEEYGEKKQNNI